jgi:hypothetical protein
MDISIKRELILAQEEKWILLDLIKIILVLVSINFLAFGTSIDFDNNFY